MKNKKYRGIQIPIEAYEQLKEFCNKHNIKMGKFVAELITERVKSGKRLIVEPIEYGRNENNDRRII